MATQPISWETPGCRGSRPPTGLQRGQRVNRSRRRVAHHGAVAQLEDVQRHLGVGDITTLDSGNTGNRRFRGGSPCGSPSGADRRRCGVRERRRGGGPRRRSGASVCGGRNFLHVILRPSPSGRSRGAPRAVVDDERRAFDARVLLSITGSSACTRRTPWTPRRPRRRAGRTEACASRGTLACESIGVVRHAG